jgi:hypothetical protein
VHHRLPTVLGSARHQFQAGVVEPAAAPDEVAEPDRRPFGWAAQHSRGGAARATHTCKINPTLKSP